MNDENAILKFFYEDIIRHRLEFLFRIEFNGAVGVRQGFRCDCSFDIPSLFFLRIKTVLFGRDSMGNMQTCR